jgi:AcrR family transcriptional regulator
MSLDWEAERQAREGARRVAWRAELLQRLDAREVPHHLWDGLLAYVTERRQPGQFLVAVLSNDLREAVNRADAESLVGLRAIVQWLCNHVTAHCFGSPEAVAAWLADPEPPLCIVD